VDQSATEKYKELAVYLGCDIFLQHEHEDVQLLVACCLADIFRIFAPESPFQDPTNLKNIFIFLANQLKGLKENSNTSFKRYFYLLENLECVKTFQLCLELEESQEIIATLFESAFKIINSQTTPKVKTLLFELLHPLLNESDQISTKVLDILFTRIIEPQKSNNKEAYNLAVNLLKKGNEHFEYVVQNHLNNILLTSSRGHNMSNNLTLNYLGVNESKGSNDSQSLNNSLNESSNVNNTSSSNQFISDKLCLIIYELNQIRYNLLELVMPQLEYKLKSSDLKERREYTKLLSKMFSEKDSRLAQQLPQLWDAYLERFADMNEDIRKICVQHICDFLIQQSHVMKTISEDENEPKKDINSEQQSSTHIIDQIMEQVKNRSLDSEESLRFEVVQEILKAIKSDSNVITLDLLNILKERTLDIKIKVRKLALQGLATLYKKIHSKSTNSRKTIQTVNWIPSKIMRIYFQESIDDKLLVERLLNSSIVPYSLNAREKMAQLYYAFTTFDDYSILSLVEIMKNRVLLYQLMKSIIDTVELSASTGSTITSAIKQTANTTQIQASKSTTAINEAKLNADIMLISQNLLDTTKGHEFMNKLIELLKQNINLRNYFKNFVQLTCSCNKSMQLIQLIFSNLSTLNQSQMSMAKRLIERMSSLIIDRECIECLIELVEYKIRQKLTPKQKRMLTKKSTSVKKSTKKRGNKKKYSESSEEDDEDEDEDDDDDENQNEDLEISEEENEEMEQDEENDTATVTTDSTGIGGGSENDKLLVKHIDDDGEKGLKLINMILMIHTNYGFASTITYSKLFSFINSRKDHVVSSTLKILSNHYSGLQRDSTNSDQFSKINEQHLEKLKHFTMNGRAKQAKHAIHLIFNNFEKQKMEKILSELYKDLINEANKKQPKNFITCLISLGHIVQLIPHLVGKDIKEFITKSIVKDILLVPATTQLSIISHSANDSSISNSLSAKRKNNLRLAGKWCENEDELPFQTRVRIESVKLLVRWCLGLKSECPSIINTLKILVRLIRENSSINSQIQQDSDNQVIVSDAEKSRLRSVCGSQLIKMAQESSFKQFITAEYFHALAKLIIDPITNIREIIIKKLQKGLKSNKLSINYMAMFALCGFDGSRERKSKVRKIYSQLIKQIRLQDQKKQQQHQLKDPNGTAPPRILPEMCLSFSVSILAHNIKIDSLKDETKVKQIKECMSIIFDPLLESPDSYQIAYIKKILNKIKISDDGMAAAAVNISSNDNTNNKTALQNLYQLNKNLCFICEIFLFHLHSKSTSYLTKKDLEKFDVKLPNGFYSARENNSNSSSQQQQLELDKEIADHMKDANQSLDKIIGDNEEEEKDEDEGDIEEQIEETTHNGVDIVRTTKKSSDKTTTTVAKSSSAAVAKGSTRIEITQNVTSKKRKATQASNEEEKENEEEEENDEDDDVVLSKLVKKKLSHESKETNNSSSNSSPPSKRNRLSGSKVNETISNRSTRAGRKKSEESEQEEEEEIEEEKEETKPKRGARSSASAAANVSTTTSKKKPAPVSKSVKSKKESAAEEQEEETVQSSSDEEEAEDETTTKKKNAPKNNNKKSARNNKSKEVESKAVAEESIMDNSNTAKRSLRQRATPAKK
jgi:hypothetical protein